MEAPQFLATARSLHASAEQHELRLDREAEAPAAPSTAPRSWVLVAEDNPINQVLIRRHLTELGCSFEIAPDGAEAARLYEQGRHDIVLMDCHMPGVDGFEATARIRGLDPALASVPIVAITTNAAPGDRQRCLDAGMDDYLYKPFSRAQLVAIMSRLLCQERLQAS